MTNETKHTPTPWKLDEIGDVFIGDKCVAVILEDDDDFSNGNRIVKCVNMHDELVEALKYVAKSGKFTSFDSLAWDVVDVVNEALKKAGAL